MTNRILLGLVGLVGALTACGGGNSAPAQPAVTEAVPAAAGTSSDAATQYVVELAAVAATQTDALEPIEALPDTLAVDDTTEPRAIE